MNHIQNLALNDPTIYETETDEDIVQAIREGDLFALEYMMNRYKNFVRAKARTYFLIGADKEDIIQEGMIGLYKAIRDYQPERTSSFHTFADICVTRQIITAVKTSTRQKHLPLNSYVSLNKPLFEEESEKNTLLDFMPSKKVVNPEEIYIGQENLHIIEQSIREKLTPLERDVLLLYLEGLSYYDIANEMKRSIKSIDNALQRVKKKMEDILREKKLDE